MTVPRVLLLGNYSKLWGFERWVGRCIIGILTFYRRKRKAQVSWCSAEEHFLFVPLISEGEEGTDKKESRYGIFFVPLTVLRDLLCSMTVARCLPACCFRDSWNSETFVNEDLIQNLEPKELLGCERNKRRLSSYHYLRSYSMRRSFISPKLSGTFPFKPLCCRSLNCFEDSRHENVGKTDFNRRLSSSLKRSSIFDEKLTGLGG